MLSGISEGRELPRGLGLLPGEGLPFRRDPRGGGSAVLGSRPFVVQGERSLIRDPSREVWIESSGTG